MHANDLKQYSFEGPVSAHQVLEKAAEIIADNYLRGNAFCNPQATKDYVKYKLGRYEREVFAILHLDNQHRLIEFEELFYGTIDSASVYPREVAKTCLMHNSAAVILAHNHPSGIPEPSIADRAITSKITEALNLIDVRTLDHIVAGETCVSMAERGML